MLRTERVGDSQPSHSTWRPPQLRRRGAKRLRGPPERCHRRPSVSRGAMGSELTDPEMSGAPYPAALSTTKSALRKLQAAPCRGAAPGGAGAAVTAAPPRSCFARKGRRSVGWRTLLRLSQDCLRFRQTASNHLDLCCPPQHCLQRITCPTPPKSGRKSSQQIAFPPGFGRRLRAARWPFLYTQILCCHTLSQPATRRST